MTCGDPSICATITGRSGRLYMYVAHSTMKDPTRKWTVIGEWKSTTPAMKDRIIERDVAKPASHTTLDRMLTLNDDNADPPLAMLSAYLITSAVMMPPKAWKRTVTSGHPVIFPNSQVGSLGVGMRIDLRPESDTSGNAAATKAGGRDHKLS